MTNVFSFSKIWRLEECEVLTDEEAARLCKVHDERCAAHEDTRKIPRSGHGGTEGDDPGEDSQAPV
jgi:hypothetical protein